MTLPQKLQSKLYTVNVHRKLNLASETATVFINQVHNGYIQKLTNLFSYQLIEKSTFCQILYMLNKILLK